MNMFNQRKILTFLLAAVWLVNGLVCKVFGLAPRHQEIVSQILGESHSGLFTFLIGFGEVFLGIWILLRKQVKLHTILQVILVLIMNVIEFTLVPSLLLWGKFNLVFAVVFVAMVIYHFHLSKTTEL